MLCLFVTRCVMHCVCDTTLQASVVKRTLKFRHEQTVNDTLECFANNACFKLRDMAKFVSQEAYTSELACQIAHDHIA